MDPLDEFLATVDWNEVGARLTAFARRRTGHVAEAEELVQEALSRLFDPKYKPWSPDTPSLEGLVGHLRSTINGIVVDRHRLRERRGRSVDHEHVVLQSPSTADASVRTADWECDALGRLNGDEEACQVFCLMVDDVQKAADQAAKLGWPVSKVYEARRRIRQKLRDRSEDT